MGMHLLIRPCQSVHAENVAIKKIIQKQWLISICRRRAGADDNCNS